MQPAFHENAIASNETDKTLKQAPKVRISMQLGTVPENPFFTPLVLETQLHLLVK